MKVVSRKMIDFKKVSSLTESNIHIPRRSCKLQKWLVLMLRWSNQVKYRSKELDIIILFLLNAIAVQGACRITAGSVPALTVDGNKYCSFGADHMLCKKTFPSDYVYNVLDMTPEFAGSIVRIHNNFRQSFANGVWPNVYLKSASDMPKLYWDDELALIAFALASRGESSTERNTIRTTTPVFPNLKDGRFDSRYIEYYAVNPNDVIEQLVPRDVFTFWAKLTVFDNFQTMTNLTSMGTKNATWLPLVLMLRSDVTSIGCSWLNYCTKPDAGGKPDPDPAKAGEALNLVCVYGTRDPPNRNVFQEGQPCTSCKYGRKCSRERDYPDLCT
ncbi:hypothetical protein GE061_013756 [Apolygus lucorum]|uniref:SCP domain-containing protein n=1 Tax=Apolygus lucorum TaxID=248454 RepID=A0A6A4JWB2_APOLU|nr:hypothetical protein GE061_013756 [Apolygus lucorum]